MRYKSCIIKHFPRMAIFYTKKEILVSCNVRRLLKLDPNDNDCLCIVKFHKTFFNLLCKGYRSPGRSWLHPIIIHPIPLIGRIMPRSSSSRPDNHHCCATRTSSSRGKIPVHSTSLFLLVTIFL